MATIIPNAFTSYSLNDQEQLEGACLTVTQKQVIQNHLSNTATEMINIEYDPEHPMRYTQQEAYKRGQLETYQFLLDSAKAAEDALNPVPPLNQ